ncbi:MAG: Phenylalanyl-tRNA synthetase alpha chain, partial [uncultured Solirubrobacteraceae bacterium]
HRRAAPRGRGGHRRRRGHRRPRGAAGPLPRAQGRAAQPPARRRRAAARAARGGRQGGQPGPPGARAAHRRAAGLPGRRRARRAPGHRPGRRDAPGRPRAARRAPPCPHRHQAGDRGRLLRPGLLHRRGPGGGARPLQLRRAQPRSGAPGARAVGHVLRRPGHRPAHPHVAHAGAGDGDGAAAHRPHRPRPRLPARLGRHPHPAVPPGRGPVGRRGHHPGRPQGHPAGLRAGDLRPGARGPPAPALLPLHRALGRGGRLVLPVRRHRHAARRRALQPLQGDGLDRDPRLGHGRPERLRLRARARLRPRADPGLRLRHGDRADRPAQARPARHAPALRQRPAAPGAVRL